MFFADDLYIGVGDSGEQLLKIIDVVHAYCCKWRATRAPETPVPLEQATIYSVSM